MLIVGVVVMIDKSMAVAAKASGAGSTGSSTGTAVALAVPHATERQLAGALGVRPRWGQRTQVGVRYGRKGIIQGSCLRTCMRTWVAVALAQTQVGAMAGHNGMARVVICSLTPVRSI